jgi:hypothetical protein
MTAAPEGRASDSPEFPTTPTVGCLAGVSQRGQVLHFDKRSAAETRVAWQLLKVIAFGPVCCVIRRQGIREVRGGMGGPARTSGRGRALAAGKRWLWVVYFQAAADGGGDGVEVAFV